MNPLFIIILVLALLILFASFFTVKQQTAAILERFGKFKVIRQSGLHLKIPLIESVNFFVCFMDLIFLKNNMTPQGLCVFKKSFSLLFNL